MGQVVPLEKVASTRGENISSDKQKTLVKRIFGASQGQIEVLAIDVGHFHIADGQSISDTVGPIEGFAGVQKDVDTQSFILQYVGNQPRDGGFVFQHQNAVPARSERGTGMHGLQRFGRQNRSRVRLKGGITYGGSGILTSRGREPD